MAKRVLHVEPNAEQRERVYEALVGTRYEYAAGVATAKEAIEILDTVKPDLIMLSLAASLGSRRPIQGDAMELVECVATRTHPPRLVVSHPEGAEVLWFKQLFEHVSAAVDRDAPRADILAALRSAEDLIPGSNPLRRKHVRVRVRGFGWFKKPGFLGLGRMKPMTLADISKGGLGFCTETAIAVGTKLKLRLDLHEVKGEIHAEAVVMWCDVFPGQRQYRVGVRFTQLSPEDRSTLASYIVRRLATQ